MELSKRHCVSSKNEKIKINSAKHTRKMLARLNEEMEEISKEKRTIEEKRQILAKFKEVAERKQLTYESRQINHKRLLLPGEQMNYSRQAFGPFNGNIPTAVDVINIQDGNGLASGNSNSKYVWGGLGIVVFLFAMICMLFKHLKSGSKCNFSCKGSCQMSSSNSFDDQSGNCDHVCNT